MPGAETNFFTRHLTAGERLRELLFGLIMTLTFTLTAGFVVGEEKDAVRELLIATIGCNVAWGIIDGGLLVLGRGLHPYDSFRRLYLRPGGPDRSSLENV